jgi:hypothetical protein
MGIVLFVVLVLQSTVGAFVKLGWRNTVYMSLSMSDENEILALPAPSTDSMDGQATSTTLLSNLGPIIINLDGTMARIPNWLELTEHEQAKTMRVIAKRNKVRKEAMLEAAAVAEGSAEKSAEEGNTR